MRVAFTREVPLEGDVVLETWIVSRSEVCAGEDVVDGKRIYFDVWVTPRVQALEAGHEALANEIHALLDNSKLSASQAAQLEREYFPHRLP